MATESLYPDAIISATNLSGSVADIDDDPDSPDGAWLTAPGNNNNTDVRVSMPTPTGVPNTGAGLQSIRVLVRKTNHSTDPSAVVELFETGGGSALATVVASTSVGSTSGVVLSGTFDASLLSTADGSAVEVRVSGTTGGGNPGNRASLEVGAIEWVADYSTGTTFSRAAQVAASSGFAGLRHLTSARTVASSGVSGVFFTAFVRRFGSASIVSSSMVAVSGLVKRLRSASATAGGALVAAAIVSGGGSTHSRSAGIFATGRLHGRWRLTSGTGIAFTAAPAIQGAVAVGQVLTVADAVTIRPQLVVAASSSLTAVSSSGAVSRQTSVGAIGRLHGRWRLTSGTGIAFSAAPTIQGTVAVGQVLTVADAVTIKPQVAFAASSSSSAVASRTVRAGVSIAATTSVSAARSRSVGATALIAGVSAVVATWRVPSNASAAISAASSATVQARLVAARAVGIAGVSGVTVARSRRLARSASIVASSGVSAVATLESHAFRTATVSALGGVAVVATVRRAAVAGLVVQSSLAADPRRIVRVAAQITATTIVASAGRSVRSREAILAAVGTVDVSRQRIVLRAANVSGVGGVVTAATYLGLSRRRDATAATSGSSGRMGASLRTGMIGDSLRTGRIARS